VPEADDSFSPYLNEGAHQHLQGGDLDAIASASAENRVLKVSAGSNPKTVAGSIAYVTRAGEAPALLALGASCINQAVKAVAIARGYVHEDGVDLALQPDFRDEERTSISLRLVKKGNGAYITELPSEAELTVSSRSEPTAVAGAVAAKVREGERCAIVGIGAECVNKAVLAVTFARHFLRDNAVDLKAVPHFVKIERDGGETVSAMKLTILAEQC
jgi:stage V sporulation protein S